MIERTKKLALKLKNQQFHKSSITLVLMLAKGGRKHQRNSCELIIKFSDTIRIKMPRTETSPNFKTYASDFVRTLSLIENQLLVKP